MAKQRTILKEISISGIGVHTGNNSTITFKPATVNSGLRFVRVDIPEKPGISADVEFVIETERGTSLGLGETKIHTVEHVLAALAGLGIDNCIIEVNANEPPFLDGSSLPFVRVIKEAGVVEQEAEKQELELSSSVSFSQGGVSLVAIPAKTLSISFTLDFDHQLLQSQYFSLDINEESFSNEIAPARTFCFVSDVDCLKEKGLIKGGSLDCAVVIGDKEILNKEPLRFRDEFTRHKIADLLGDIALLGCPLRAHVISIKSGHATNIPFVKKLREHLGRKPIRVPFDINTILKIMPHRYPFLLVDRIFEIEDRKRIVGIKNVTINEPYFQGHFPGHPIMPAVLQIEAMAQIGGILLLNTVENPEEKLVYFMEIDKARFRKPVMPGDQIRFELELVKLKGRVCKMKGVGFVDGSPVCEAEMMAMIVDKVS